MYGRISVKSLRCSRPIIRVTLRLRRYKKRFHTQHELIETRNLKGQIVMRCKESRCKHHFFLILLTRIVKAVNTILFSIFFIRSHLEQPLLLESALVFSYYGYSSTYHKDSKVYDNTGFFLEFH